MNNKLNDIKAKLALPPIPSAAPTSRSHKARNRNRIRFEVTPVIGKWLMEIAEEKLAAINVTDAKFKPAYDFYYQIKSQIDKMGPTT